MRLMNKKGQALTKLQGFLMALIGVSVMLAVGLLVLGNLQTVDDPTSKYCGTGYTYNTSAAETAGCTNTSVGGGPTAVSHSASYNATGSIMTKLATVPTWVGIIIVVALAFVVLGFFYAVGGSGNM